MSTPAKPIVLTSSEWIPSSVKYMPPKINDRGGKSIPTISTQSKRSLHITTPLMMTWGVNDFVDEKTGESDGKYSISLNFPNADYSNAATDSFLQKLKDFENQILDDAVRHSELWWGEEMSREVCKHTFFPFLKYSKNKDTKKIDLSKPPSIRAKVPFYNDKWAVEIYDTKSNLIFPCENENLTPVDFIPKMSSVACVLQCGGIWIGGKGWGLTWKLIQCVVKPREIISVYGKCQIQLSVEDRDAIDTQVITEDLDDEVSSNTKPAAKVAVSVDVQDSEDDEPLSIVVPEPVAQPAAVMPPAAPVAVKKVIKKPVEAPVEVPAVVAPVAVAEEPTDAAAPAKKVVKKVIKKAT